MARNGQGGRLRDAGARAGLTQEQLADRAGVATEHLQRLERGVGSPTLATVYALADAMDCQLSELVEVTLRVHPDDSPVMRSSAIHLGQPRLSLLTEESVRLVLFK